MADNGGPFRLMWPEIDDADSAKGASRLGVVAAVLFSLWTAAVVTYAVFVAPASLPLADPLAYIDAGIFAVLAIGIWKLWRTAAVIALLLFVVEQVYAALLSGPGFGLIMPLVLTLFLVSGVRGTFAYHKFLRQKGTSEGADA